MALEVLSTTNCLAVAEELGAIAGREAKVGVGVLLDIVVFLGLVVQELEAAPTSGEPTRGVGAALVF